MSEVHLTVDRATHAVDGHEVRWLNIDSCPHGEDLGSIEVSDVAFKYNGPFRSDGMTGGTLPIRPVWSFRDLGNGRCAIAPSFLIPRHHAGRDCHFGPGEFAFAWAD